MNQRYIPVNPFPKATNLSFNTIDISLDNYMVTVAEQLSSIIEHLISKEFKRVVFVQNTIEPNDPLGASRVGVLLTNEIPKTPEEAEGGANLYRFKWFRLTNDDLNCILRVGLCHSLAVACGEATGITWNSVSLTPDVHVVAPSVVLKRYM